MPVTRSRLSRGVKLVKQHLTAPLNQIQTLLSAAGVENLERRWGVARVNLHVPVLDSDFFKEATTDGQKIDFTIPFVLPPLQDYFDASGQTDTDTPEIILDEISVSFDQRSEAAAVSDYTVAADQGFLNFLAINQLNLRIALVEKTQAFFDNNVSNIPEREVVSLTLDSVAYAGRTLRVNPFVKTELSKVLNPYKTYVLLINAQDMYGATHKVCLPSLLVSFKIRHPLIERDKGNTIQNLPVSHFGGATGETISVPNPAANSKILADGANGVQTGIEAVDQVLLRRLKGGYRRDSDVAPKEHIQTDSTYEIFAVPMWANFGVKYGVRAGYNVSDLPYMTDLRNDDLTIDRRIIPICYPFAIHHVMAVANYGWPHDGTNNGKAPASATLTNQVGVGIGTGLRGDLFAYQQVAYASWTPANKVNIGVDQIKSRAGGTLTSEDYDFDILNVPLIGTGGDGYYAQGRPFFVGRATSKMTQRTNVNDPAVAPATQGLEQWLEVRWAFQDTAGLGYTAPPDAGPFGAGDDTFATATAITGTAGSTAATDTVPFSKEVGEPNHAGDAGGKSAWWTWTCPSDGVVTIDTTGSLGAGGLGLPNPLLGVYTGAAVGSLTTIASHAPGPGGVATVTFSATGGTTYKIAYDGAGGLGQQAVINWDLDSGAAASPYTTYVGRGGNWVLIVGSKSLVGDGDNT